MFKTVKNKFIILSILFIVSSVTIPITFLILQFKQNFDQRSLVMVESTLDLLRSGIERSMRQQDHSEVQHLIEHVSKSKSIAHIRILSNSGQVLYSSNPVEINQMLEVVEPHHIDFSDEIIHDRQIERLSVNKGFKISEPIKNIESCQDCHGENESLGILDVDIRLTEAEVNFSTGSVHFIFLAIAIIITMFLGSYYLFNHYINKPLNLFFRAINDVEKGDLSVRLPAAHQDEFSLLQNHFNQMVSRLQTSKEKIEELHFEQLQHADKLVTLGELTSEMAHEINNHAAIILSRTDFIKLDTKDELGLNKYKEDLDVIINQIGKVSKITRNILRHGKKKVENFLKLDLIHVCEESLQILDPILDKRRILLKKEYETSDAIILGDPVQIEQLITNLAINALDAIENEGELILKVKEDDSGKLQLIISDSGKGIKESEIKQIFSPFYTTKSPHKGTGLGLYIVKSICENHNAIIECESQPGEGTSFIITFNGEIE